MAARAYDVERGDRPQQWLDFLDRQVLRYSLNGTTCRPDGFAIDARGRASGPWKIGRIQTTGGGCRLVRGEREIARNGDGDYILYLPVESRIDLQQFGRSAICRSRSFALVSGADTLVHAKSGDNDTIYFGLPRGFVERRLRDPGKHCAGLVPATSGLAGLAAHALLSLEREAPDITDDELPAAAAAVGDLVMLALAGRADLGSSVSTVRAGNLARAKRIIRSRLGEHDLVPATVARSCGISLSYLHNLFRDDGRTMREFLLEQRLERARSLLARGEASTVTEAALECGFSNMSSFSTAFRAAFGMPPRDVMRSRELR